MLNVDLSIFQSTPPSREATRSDRRLRYRLNFNPRLPHGRRHSSPGPRCSYYYFNPRLPHGRRRKIVTIRERSRDFNPRLPHGRRPVSAIIWHLRQAISIHASLTGGDHARERESSSGHHFNPRLPHGRRHNVIAESNAELIFQSTPPSREATRFFRLEKCPNLYFNPRLPHGRRRGLETGGSEEAEISIHASLTGGDSENYQF